MVTPYLIAMSFGPGPWPYIVFKFCSIITVVMFVSAFCLWLGRKGTAQRAKAWHYQVYAWGQGFLIAGMALCAPTAYTEQMARDAALRAWYGEITYGPDVTRIVFVLMFGFVITLGLASLAMWLDLMKNARGPGNDSESQVSVTAHGA